MAQNLGAGAIFYSSPAGHCISESKNPHRYLEQTAGASRVWSKGSRCEHKLMSPAMACR
jgi:hypothetical protein